MLIKLVDIAIIIYEWISERQRTLGAYSHNHQKYVYHMISAIIKAEAAFLKTV